MTRVLDLVKDGYSLLIFIARRGYPKNIIVDNGKIFTAHESQAFCSNKGISWGFSPAKAPWQKDFWERPVLLCQKRLKKVVGN